MTASPQDAKKPGPDRPAPAVAQAEATLARPGVQIEAMQSVLVRLLQDVVNAERRIERSDAAQLAEVNEALVVSALSSQLEAEQARQALEQALPAAALDGLTGLPNRSTLLDRFGQAVALARRRGTRLALLYLDLDAFKPLNDAFGHAFGDKVLCLVAERMLSVVREMDTVSRHGGDEFVVLLAEVKEPHDAQAVAEKLIAAIATPALIEGREVQLTASVGIALYPDHGADLDTLVARADAAMYTSKRVRSGGVALHDDAIGAGSVASPATAAHRGRALDPETRLAQLREANEKLVLAVLSAQELRDAAEAAQRRQAAFLAAVADELRNPMAPIRIALAMLGRTAGDEPLLPRVEGLIRQQKVQLSRLVDHLVDASTTMPGALPQEHVAVDLARVIERAIAGEREVMQARGQHFESHLPPGALPVSGDEVHLELIVANLLDNASKHTPEGGHISLSVVTHAQGLTLTVTDNGIGIPEPVRVHLFDPFVQDVHALGLNGVGVGIGLTVARALARAHGGELVAHSAGTGRGSQFVLTLPGVVTVAPPAPGDFEPAR